MRKTLPLLALAGSLLCTPLAAALSEYGIEGMGRVSTRANEVRASLSPDGQRIVFASDRDGGAGGWDLWQATLEEGRWSLPQALPLNTQADEHDPFFSADGRWLYFASNREGGHGGLDLYRAPVEAAGIGAVQPIPGAVNTRADERSPALDLHGHHLLLVRTGSEGGSLLLARAQPNGFAAPQPLPVDEAGDVLDASWLGNGRALLFTRRSGPHSQVWLAACKNGRYRAPAPLPLSFNTADGITRGALVDASKPSELVVSGSARAPRAGGLDLYRMKAPAVEGEDNCL